MTTPENPSDRPSDDADFAAYDETQVGVPKPDLVKRDAPAAGSDQPTEFIQGPGPQDPYAQDPYAQNSNAQNPNAQPSYGQAPYSQNPYGAPPPAYGQPYGQPGAYGYQYGPPPGLAPQTGQVSSIVALVFGGLLTVSCYFTLIGIAPLVLGIMGLTKANSVNGLWMSGRAAEAEDAAASSKKLAMWAWISLGIGVVIAAIIITILIVWAVNSEPDRPSSTYPTSHSTYTVPTYPTFTTPVIPTFPS